MGLQAGILLCRVQVTRSGGLRGTRDGRFAFPMMCVSDDEGEEQMLAKGARLNFTALWLVAAITGLAENWLLSSFGLNITQRTIVGLGFVPLLVFLALTCAFQQIALQRK